MPRRRCADLAYLWPSISVPKMHFTETVALPGACVLGDFDRLWVGGLAKFLRACGKHFVAQAKISANGALQAGVQGRNLPILRVFGMLLASFCMVFALKSVQMTSVRELGTERREGKSVRFRVP